MKLILCNYPVYLPMKQVAILKIAMYLITATVIACRGGQTSDEVGSTFVTYASKVQYMPMTQSPSGRERAYECPQLQ